MRPRLLDSVRDVLLSGEPVLVSGIVQFERDRGQGALGVDEEGFELPPQAKIVLEEVAPLAESLRARTKSVRIKLPVDRAERSKLVALRETLSAHPGACPVTIELTTQERWSVVLTVAGMAVEPSEKLMSALERVFGEKVCELR